MITVNYGGIVIWWLVGRCDLISIWGALSPICTQNDHLEGQGLSRVWSMILAESAQWVEKVSDEDTGKSSRG